MQEIINSVLEEIIHGQDIRHKVTGIKEKMRRNTNRVEAAIRHYRVQLKAEKMSIHEIKKELSNAINRPKFSTSAFWPVYAGIRTYDKLFCGDILSRVKVSGNIEDILKLREKGALVFIPNHIDMLDTLVMGYLNHLYRIRDRIIHAGENLAVPGVNVLGNRLGLLWLKRANFSYMDLIGYSCSVQNYVQKKYPQWVYIEGTRSRTGKIAPVVNKIYRLFGRNKVPQKPMKPGFTFALLRANRRVEHPIYIVPVTNNIPIIYDVSEDYLKGSKKEQKMNIFQRYKESMKYLQPYLPEMAVHFGEPIELEKDIGDFMRDVQALHGRIKVTLKKNMPVLSMNLIAYTMRYLEHAIPDFNELDKGQRKVQFEMQYNDMADNLLEHGINNNIEKYDKSMYVYKQLGYLDEYRLNITAQVEYSSNLIEHHLRKSFPLRKK